MEKHILLMILLFLIQYYSFSVSLASSNETDRQALLAFQNLITSLSHFVANNWTRNTSFCSWFGITCSPKRQRVVALTLPNLQLQGTISPSLANLSFLTELNLENNSFHGGIPYDLGRLPLLRVIDVQNNQLNGSIPASLFQHQKVQKISLAYNELSGEMWKGPWYVPELRVLNLRNNSFTGVIPPSVGNATKLLNFSLSGNRINGNIPKEIGNLSQLTELFLYDNQLTGIPQLLNWWRVRQNQFSRLSKMVKDLLAIQATSVASELAFSARRFQIGEHRYSLAEDSLEISVLFRDWINADRCNKGLPRLTLQYELFIDLIIDDNSEDDMKHEDRLQNLPRSSVDHTRSLQDLDETFSRLYNY